MVNTKTIKKEHNVKIVNEKMTIHIYGQSNSPIVADKKEIDLGVKSRAPASVLEQDVPVDNMKETAAVSPYSKDYKKTNSDSDKLINDLKNL